ncbi:MAG: hypothetical protein K2X24_17860, partial [Methylobacterium sp.]|nr:hypothetical protein [Methylobacterium sp.]
MAASSQNAAQAGRGPAPRGLRGALLALAMTGLGGCVVGPDYVPPADPPVTRYTREPLANPSAADTIRTAHGGSADQNFVSGADVPG